MNLCAARVILPIDAFGGMATLLKCRNIIPLVLRICRIARTTNATNWNSTFHTYVRKTASLNVSRMYCFVDRISATGRVKMLQYRYVRNHFHHSIMKNK